MRLRVLARSPLTTEVATIQSVPCAKNGDTCSRSKHEISWLFIEHENSIESDDSCRRRYRVPHPHFLFLSSGIEVRGPETLFGVHHVFR